MEHPCCWNCCHKLFEGCMPIGYPINYKNGHFETVGTFCSFECLKRYNLDMKNSTKSSRAIERIMLMRKRMYGVVTPLVAAPSRLCLKMFGGTLDIRDYRINSVGYEVQLPDCIKLPFKVCSSESTYESAPKQQARVECKTLVERTREAEDMIFNGQSDDNELQTLRLRRPVSTTRSVTNIATLLGLVKK